MSERATASSLLVLTSPLLSYSSTDVLWGRGGHTTCHPGNVQYRNLTVHYRDSFRAAGKAAKLEIAKEIVSKWRSQTPMGRFLVMSEPTKGKDSLWHDVGDEEAAKKVMGSLRQRKSKSDFMSLGAVKEAQQAAAHARSDSLMSFGSAAQSSLCSLTSAGNTIHPAPVAMEMKPAAAAVPVVASETLSTILTMNPALSNTNVTSSRNNVNWQQVFQATTGTAAPGTATTTVSPREHLRNLRANILPNMASTSTTTPSQNNNPMRSFSTPVMLSPETSLATGSAMASASAMTNAFVRRVQSHGPQPTQAYQSTLNSAAGSSLMAFLTNHTNSSTTTNNNNSRGNYQWQPQPQQPNNCQPPQPSQALPQPSQQPQQHLPLVAALLQEQMQKAQAQAQQEVQAQHIQVVPPQARELSTLTEEDDDELQAYFSQAFQSSVEAATEIPLAAQLTNDFSTIFDEDNMVTVSESAFSDEFDEDQEEDDEDEDRMTMSIAAKIGAFDKLNRKRAATESDDDSDDNDDNVSVLSSEESEDDPFQQVIFDHIYDPFADGEK